MTILKHGILHDPRVQKQLYPNIEKGPLVRVNSLVIHQTGAPTAQHTFNSYQTGGHGAHFLIDKNGVIYQTARLDKRTHHVGTFKSKCYETKVCSPAQLKAATQILFKKGESYPTRVRQLHDTEKAKSYPERYPLNIDSLGIEIVGNYNIKEEIYENVSSLQNQSLQ